MKKKQWNNTDQILSEVSSFWNGDDKPDDFIKTLSHFQDFGKWKKEDPLWDKIGLDNLARLETLKTLSGKTKVDSMLEWGVGGGANAVKFSKEIDFFYGTDISLDSISECEEKLKAEGSNCVYQLTHIQIEKPDIVYELVPKVDFFLCTSVFQHFPTQEYGASIAHIAYQMLKDDGIALMQIKYGEHTNYFNYDYNTHYATFTLYPLPLFWALMEQIGFKVLAVTLETNIFYAYYYLERK